MLELASGKIPGHPTGGLSIADVDDVALAFAFALDKANSGERYILAGTNLTYAQAFAAQAKAVGTIYDGKPLPTLALKCAANFLETRSRFSGKEPRLTRDNAAIAPLRMWYTSARAQEQLGYRPRSLDETLERMALAYRQAGAL
jgi:dihydroflavonol-4-reductase